MKSGHIIILMAIVAAVGGTFLAASRTGEFAAITGNAVGGSAAAATVNGLQAVAGGALFLLATAAALVVVTRIGRQEMAAARGSPAKQSPATIEGKIRKAEDAVNANNTLAAYALYNEIRQGYAALSAREREQHHPRVLGIHQAISRQAQISEAHQLTEKYVNETITEQEFERLKQLIADQ